MTLKKMAPEEIKKMSKFVLKAGIDVPAKTAAEVTALTDKIVGDITPQEANLGTICQFLEEGLTQLHMALRTLDERLTPVLAPVKVVKNMDVDLPKHDALSPSASSILDSVCRLHAALDFLSHLEARLNL
jgi:hypothetical protein